MGRLGSIVSGLVDILSCLNSADYGGGVLCFEGGIIEKCTINSNTTTVPDDPETPVQNNSRKATKIP